MQAPTMSALRYAESAADIFSVRVGSGLSAFTAALRLERETPVKPLEIKGFGPFSRWSGFCIL
jgi:hypothetical protein